MFPETFMLSTRSLLRSGCRSSVSRAGELVWFDPSRPVTKVSAAQVHTNVIRAACLTTHVQLREGKTGLIVSCRRRSSNMTWGEEAPAEVAAALPHYAQVIAFQALFVIQMRRRSSARDQLWKALAEDLQNWVFLQPTFPKRWWRFDWVEFFCFGKLCCLLSSLD